MKTILIPTDFNEDAVIKAEFLLSSLKNEPVKLIFFHAFKITDSISDLLMLSRRTADYALIPESFHKACYEMQVKSRPNKLILNIEYFYGSTMAAFRNFAEGNGVNYAFMPEEYLYQKISKYSLDPRSFIHKSGIPIITVTEAQEIQSAINRPLSLPEVQPV